MNYIKNEFFRAFCNRKTISAFSLSFLCLLIGAYEPLKYSSKLYDFADTFIMAQTTGVASLIALLFPLICSLPYSTSHITECESGYINYIFTKTERKLYIKTKLIVNGLVGGFVISIPCFIIFIIIIMFKGLNLSVDSGSVINFYKDFYLSYPILYVLFLILNSFICGFIFANLGLGISAFIKNKYIVAVLPFCYYIFSAIVLSNFSIYFNAVTLFDIHQYAEQSRIGIYIYDFILLIIGVMLFSLGVQKIEHKNKIEYK